MAFNYVVLDLVHKYTFSQTALLNLTVQGFNIFNHHSKTRNNKHGLMATNINKNNK